MECRTGGWANELFRRGPWALGRNYKALDDHMYLTYTIMVCIELHLALRMLGD
jgi:hypothetical protein